MADAAAGGGAPRGFRFGPFELDLATAELTREGRRVRLQDKPFELLVALIEAKGGLVTRASLHERLWPGVIVDFETSLNAAVRRLREALEDSADAPRYVETIPRRGYRFLVDAAPIAAAAGGAGGAAADAGAGPRTGGAAAPGATAHHEAAGHATRPGAGDDEHAGVRRRRFLSGMALGMTLVAVFAVILFAVARHPPDDGRRRTLLVLPFTTLGPDSSDVWLGDGLADEMITRLGRLDPLRLGVIARTSARRFADAGHDLDDARRLLGAHFVLEGSVRREGERVRVSASLVEVDRRTQLWSDSFDRDARDVLALESDIAAHVARALALKLLPAPTRAGATQVNPAAHDAVLRARHFWNQQTPEGFRRAGAAYREAIAADSTYAPAWAGLATTYAMVGIYDFLPPREVFPLARTAAGRALAIDSTSAEGWSALGLIQMAFDWDWKPAESSLRRALAINASDAAAHEMYAILLAATGRGDEALRESRRALEVDPLSLILNSDRGWLLFMARRYEDANFQLLKTLQLDPNFYVAHDDLSWVCFVKGDMDGYLFHTLKAMTLSGHTPEDVAAARARFEREGWRKWRAENAAEAVAASRHEYVSPYDIALDYAALGEKQEALKWLERSFEAREIDLIMLNADPRMDAVRGMPEFDALVGRIGLPQAGKPRG